MATKLLWTVVYQTLLISNVLMLMHGIKETIFLVLLYWFQSFVCKLFTMLKECNSRPVNCFLITWCPHYPQCHWVTTCSFLWSHKSVYTTVSAWPAVLHKTCKHTSVYTIGGEIHTFMYFNNTVMKKIQAIKVFCHILHLFLCPTNTQTSLIYIFKIQCCTSLVTALIRAV